MIDDGEEEKTYCLSKAVSPFLKDESLWQKENGFWIVMFPGVSMFKCLPIQRAGTSALSLYLISTDI